MKTLILTLGAMLAMMAPARAQTTSTTTAEAGAATRFAEASITPTALRRHLTELASDAYQGRGTGQAGQKKAAAYLAEQFRQLGLQAPDLTSATRYLQPFSIVETVPTAPGTIEVGNQKFQGLQDFVRFGSSMFPAGVTPADPVFRGFGIETSNYHDYSGQPDVRGKDVVVLQGEPNNGLGRYLFSGSKQESEWSSVMRKAYMAREQGARSLTVVSYATANSFQKLARPMLGYLAAPSYSLTTPVLSPTAPGLMLEFQPAYISTFITNGPLGMALFGTTEAVLRRYETECYKQSKPVAAEFKLLPFQVELPEARLELATENVLAMVEGTDKKDEVLVISAHYDHIGMRHDTIFNGADEDASGVSAVLTMAKAFQDARAAGLGPRRSVLFLLTAAEEKGMLGSEYYAVNPAVPLAQTIANLNLAMLGRTDKRHTGKAPYVYIVGSDRLSTELHQISEATNARSSRLALDYTYNAATSPDQLYYRSDQYNFARYGVPAMAYTSGLHADYHKPTDDAEKIEFEKLMARARLVFYTAWDLANRDKRIVVDSNKK
ncbi:M28 family peptidase [Hymenobacter aerophilus]|uniref:M28 family peptidase n=1 Tax=Hymenobacter aerophilus TaxID=119644 RepID=UPI000475EC5F|nr:M28 family peptidase [Hymenobacter aerophilus]